MAGPAVARVALQGPRKRSLRRIVVGGVGAFVVGLTVLLLVLTSVIADVARGPSAAAGAAASDEAVEDIPADYLSLYFEAGAEWGVDWSVLAGIGKVECDHGRSRLPGCNPRGTINSAGARGPMQFLGSTWRASALATDLDVAGPSIPEGRETEGYATDADGDGSADPWSAADAIHAAARVLRRNGAPDYQAALLSYNDSDRYVTDVLAYAARYRAPPTGTHAGFTDTDGEIPRVGVDCPGGGQTVVHVELAPSLRQLYQDASDDGLRLCGGGYRSAAQQIERRRANCGTTRYDVYVKPPGECSPPTALPGKSMHEQGLAVDFTCDGSIISSRDTPCSDWLEEHAHEYGLRNLPSEPWHYSTTGG